MVLRNKKRISSYSLKNKHFFTEIIVTDSIYVKCLLNKIDNICYHTQQSILKNKIIYIINV